MPHPAVRGGTLPQAHILDVDVEARIFPYSFSIYVSLRPSPLRSVCFDPAKPSPEEDKMTAEKKIAQGRLSLLQLAEKLPNLSEVCRQRGIFRSRFYESKQA